MIRSFCIVLAILLITCHSSFSQVSEIRRASSSHRPSEGGRSNSGSSGAGYGFLFQVAMQQMIAWQQQTLHKRSEIPSMVSLEVMLQSAVQPSNYYIINPRVRGNWGLFSTDFRFNYLLEEEIGDLQHLRTNDWQVLQLNFIRTRAVAARVGAGFLQEAFGERNTYSEWTLGLQVRPTQSRLGGAAEYRGSEVRHEVNAQFQYALFNRGRLHAHLTAGGVFQRYYAHVNVWGLQGGMIFSLY